MGISFKGDGELLGKSQPVEPDALYGLITATRTASAAADPFTAHVFASLLTLAIIEARQADKPLSESLGLERGALEQLVAEWLPAAFGQFDTAREPADILFDEEEEQVRELLLQNAPKAREEGRWLAAMITRRAMQPNHLWQDLGLRNRDELGRLLTDWFGPLARRNTGNMKWKKFFYRALCELEGFTLCTAPTCRECPDFADCFGEEKGVSLLARARNGTDV